MAVVTPGLGLALAVLHALFVGACSMHSIVGNNLVQGVFDYIASQWLLL